METEQERSIALTRTWLVCLVATLCCLLWGSAFPGIKIGYRLFAIATEDTASQLLFAGCRFALAGCMTIVIGSVVRQKPLVPARTSLPHVFILSAIQTVVQYLFFYLGLARTSGVKSSVIGASNTFFSIFLASLVFRQERLTMRKIAGCLLGFSGVVLINLTGDGIDLHFAPTGEGFILLSTLAYALSSVLIKRFSANDDPVTLSGYQFLLGGTALAGLGAVFGGRLRPAADGAYPLLVYLAFVSAVAYTLWSILLKYNPVSKVTVFGFMNPMFGVLLSIVFLGEDWTAFGVRGLFALLSVCVGIYVVNRTSDVRKDGVSLIHRS
ncbi:MAG: DMT family transporter [Sphaerochaetaceae bacterium]